MVYNMTERARDDYITDIENRKTYLAGVIDCLLALNHRNMVIDFIKANIDSLRTEEWITAVKELIEPLREVDEFDKLLGELNSEKYKNLPRFPSVSGWRNWPSMEKFIDRVVGKE